MRVGFIGAGKVGFSLGKYLKLGGVTVTGYYSHSLDSAKEAAEFTATRYYEDLASITEDSDTLFITVADGAIADVWEEICNLPIKNKNICHCSGSISSTVFFNAEKMGAYRYSVHPIYALSDKYNSYQDLKNAYFSIEGSKAHLKEIKDCLTSLGNQAAIIDTEKKALYHCAAVMVSNQMVALADLGAEMLAECGFDRSEAERALAPLIEGNAKAIVTAGPEKALTGPVERGDVTTVRKHLAVLNPEIAEIYKALSNRQVLIAERKHPERDYQKVKEELGR